MYKNEQKIIFSLLQKQQLAGLLISRQIIGNLRESAWPYLMEQWRMAMISFKLWGAMSPTNDSPPPTNHKLDNESNEECKKSDVDEMFFPDRPLQGTQNIKRSIGQAEIESSYFKVFLILKFDF